MIFAPGTRIDRYRVIGQLGEGGMATVYLVRHTELDSLHAMKVLHITRPDIQQRLVREGRVLAGLRHPNIVAVTDAIRLPVGPALIMDYIEGPSLQDLLEHRDLTLAQADDLAQGILAGVEAVHATKLVHRDLKPANILLAIEAGRVVPKVADFGLVKLLDASGAPRTTRSGLGIGTPAFMAPEQMRSAADVDARADVFSLGAVFYEMVTGRPAFDGDSAIEIMRRSNAGAFHPIRESRPDVPRRMIAAIEGALAPTRDDRIASITELWRVWQGDGRDTGLLAPGDVLWDGEELLALRAMAPRPRIAPTVDHPTLEPPSGAPGPTSDDRPALPTTPLQAAPEAERRGVPWWIWAPGAIAALAIVAVGGAVLGSLATRALPAAPSASEPTPVTAPIDPATAAPPPAAPEAEPESVLSPAPFPEPTLPPPNPARDRPTPTPHAAPAPVASTAPRPTTVPAPAPSPTAAPDPAPAVPTRIAPGTRISVVGVPRAHLLDPSGRRVPIGDVPPGTYRLFVTFDDTPVEIRTLTVASGETVRVVCSASERTCH